MQDLIKNLRKLAKSNYWQTLFSSSKMLNGINMFDNNTNFTHIQLSFLNWLAYYNSLNYYFEDGSMPNWAYENDLYIDACLHYIKNKKKKEKNSLTKETDRLSKDIMRKESQVTLQGLKIIFKGKEE